MSTHAPTEAFAARYERPLVPWGALSVIGDDHIREAKPDQDACAGDPFYKAFAIGDGLGSTKDADKTSQTITSGFVDAWGKAIEAAFNPVTGDPRLAARWSTVKIAAHCVAEANRGLWDRKDSGTIHPEGKSTLTGVLCDGVGYAAVQIGDSFGLDLDVFTRRMSQLAGGPQTDPEMPWVMYNSIGGPNRGGRLRDASEDRIEYLPLAEDKPTRVILLTDGVLKGLELWYEEEDPEVVLERMVRHIASLENPQDVANFLVHVIARGKGRRTLPNRCGDDASAEAVDLPPAPSRLYLPDGPEAQPRRPRIVIPQLRLVYDEDWDPKRPPGSGGAARRIVRPAGGAAVRHIGRL
ncbi:MAG TPA: protein phosphatase 2C domain-containing protein [Candidatus Saccharimonadales bacterium]|nr:protein phosphatase 2C domain-containing protein [Candidatus Saccharimonadales bacterium]